MESSTFATLSKEVMELISLIICDAERNCTGALSLSDLLDSTVRVTRLRRCSDSLTRRCVETLVNIHRCTKQDFNYEIRRINRYLLGRSRRNSRYETWEQAAFHTRSGYGDVAYSETDKFGDRIQFSERNQVARDVKPVSGWVPHVPEFSRTLNIPVSGKSDEIICSPIVRKLSLFEQKYTAKTNKSLCFRMLKEWHNHTQYVRSLRQQAEMDRTHRQRINLFKAKRDKKLISKIFRTWASLYIRKDSFHFESSD